MFAPKSVCRGVAGSYCWVYYMGIGDYSICSIFPLQQKIWGQSCSAVLIPRNPWKAMFAPKSVSRGVAGSYCWVYYMGKDNSVFAQSFHYNREFRGQSCSAVLISRNPQKAMFAPKSVSRGVAGSYCWVYYMGKDNSVFAQSFQYNREFRGQGWSAVLISRKPRKAMFAPKSVCRGVAGSYCWEYYMGIGDYSICSIFPLQQRILKPKLFGCTHFPQPPESNVCPQKCL